MCEAMMELDMDALEILEEGAEGVGSEGEQEEEQPSSATRKKSEANPKKRKGRTENEKDEATIEGSPIETYGVAVKGPLRGVLFGSASALNPIAADKPPAAKSDHEGDGEGDEEDQRA